MRKIDVNIKKVGDLYWKRGLSLRKISKELGISAGKIRNEMVEQSIPRRQSTKRDLTLPSKKTIEELYVNKEFTLIDITKNLDVNISTVFRWMKHYNIRPRRRMKYRKFPFSGDLHEKTYLQGMCFGDFHVRKHCRQICVEVTTTHPSMIQLFYELFKNYGTPRKYPKYNKKTGRYEWGVYVLLDKSFEFLLSKSNELVNGNFYSFLAGFFDAEGCLHIYNNHGYIGLTALIYNSNKELLELINNKLKSDNFNTKFSIFSKKGRKTTDGYYSKVDLWVVRLHTKKDVINLIRYMPLKHNEKLQKAKIALSASYENMWGVVADKVITIQNKIKKEVQTCVSLAAKSWKEKTK